MLLYCCYTPAHEILYREVFLPSVPAGFELRSSVVGIGGAGDYLSKEFLRCIRVKLDLVIASIEANPGEIIVWSDVDIRFLKLTPERLLGELECSGCDLIFQSESPRMPDVNTGFFVCKCTPPVLDFFRTIRAELDSHPEDNEQMAINRVLNVGQTGSGDVTALAWGMLPKTFYARTHGWPPPRNPAIYHANYTKGTDAIGQKIMQFAEMDALVHGGLPARLWSVIWRIPRKFFPA